MSFATSMPKLVVTKTKNFSRRLALSSSSHGLVWMVWKWGSNARRFGGAGLRSQLITAKRCELHAATTSFLHTAGTRVLVYERPLEISHEHLQHEFSRQSLVTTFSRARSEQSVIV